MKSVSAGASPLQVRTKGVKEIAYVLKGHRRLAHSDLEHIYVTVSASYASLCRLEWWSHVGTIHLEAMQYLKSGYTTCERTKRRGGKDYYADESNYWVSHPALKSYYYYTRQIILFQSKEYGDDHFNLRQVGLR